MRPAVFIKSSVKLIQQLKRHAGYGDISGLVHALSVVSLGLGLICVTLAFAVAFAQPAPAMVLQGQVTERVAPRAGQLGIEIRVPYAAEVYHMPAAPWISRVMPGSSAERAGVLPGDVMLTVDGRSVSGMDRKQLDATISNTVGDTVAMWVLRVTPSGAQSRVLLNVPVE